MSLDVFSQDDFEEIDSKELVILKNKKLLEIILERIDVKQLIDFRIALERTGQQHVVNYLEWDGGEYFVIFALYCWRCSCY